MNERQKALLEKEFKVNDRFSISRGDYENMPDPMFAWRWNDKQMEELAENISLNLVDPEGLDVETIDDDFWKTMEDEAVRMGMEYYEDFDDDYVEQIEHEWDQIA